MNNEPKRRVGRPSALSIERRAELLRDYKTGKYSYTQLQHSYKVGRATIFRNIHSARNN